jgi:hypothetical protein
MEVCMIIVGNVVRVAPTTRGCVKISRKRLDVELAGIDTLLILKLMDVPLLTGEPGTPTAAAL